MKKLNQENYGEWALITGASSGLGKEFAIQIAKNGFNTILVARNKTSLEELSLSLKTKYKVDTKIVIADLKEDNQIQNIIDECETLDVGLLVNCAGLAQSREFCDNKIEDELDILNVNVKAPMVLTHFFGQKMRTRKKGGIIFVSSIMAFAGASSWANYNATKAHNLLLSEGIGSELKKDNVEVLALTPGTIQTGFQRTSNTNTNLGALDAKQVVKDGLNSLGQKRTVTTGLKNKFIAFLTRITPRSINTAIFSMVVNKIKN
ncbi:MAG: SDR family NAD(P)-dependent oxidoreductase [Campylobacteraceae bacterium]|nr:SDR family NAD(P)-dependent oxidoreductase [Campylobacteraceae bacterium]